MSWDSAIPWLYSVWCQIESFQSKAMSFSRNRRRRRFMMKKQFKTLCMVVTLAVSSSFAWGWTGASVPTQVGFYNGCGDFEGKEVMWLTFGSTTYWAASSKGGYDGMKTSALQSVSALKRVTLYQDATAQFSIWASGVCMPYSDMKMIHGIAVLAN